METGNPQINDPGQDNGRQFELTPEEATGFGGPQPGRLNRKRLMIAVCASFALIVGGGLLFNIIKTDNKRTRPETEASAADTPSALLRSMRDQAVSRRNAQADDPPPQEPEENFEEQEPLLPQVSFNRPPEPEPPRYAPPPPPQNAGPPGPDPSLVFRASLVPHAVEGSLFGGPRQNQQQAPQAAPGYNAAADAYLQNAPAAQNALRGQGSGVSDYAAQNSQADKQAFYGSSNPSDAAVNGRFLGENALWIGTVIPGILETAVNTDLPGSALARVTQNVYDSQTGGSLLIPQGTLLIARYNSSVSYAQRRVQIVWDALIRPDGFHLDLGGMNSVDKSGMSGQGAVYNENWFEYLKAAGIVTLFSVANADMAETAAKYASDASAAAVAESNSALVNQLGGGMVSRAMNIQPTLTVASGTLINIMLNKTLYLPPVNSLHAIKR